VVSHGAHVTVRVIILIWCPHNSPGILFADYLDVINNFRRRRVKTTIIRDDFTNINISRVSHACKSRLFVTILCSCISSENGNPPGRWKLDSERQKNGVRGVNNTDFWRFQNYVLGDFSRHVQQQFFIIDTVLYNSTEKQNTYTKRILMSHLFFLFLSLNVITAITPSEPVLGGVPRYYYHHGSRLYTVKTGNR